MSEEVRVSRASTKASSSDSGVGGRGGAGVAADEGAEAPFGVAVGGVAAVAILRVMLERADVGGGGFWRD